MPVEIGDTVFLSQAEVMARAGVSRQTFWRWRKKGVIPLGHRRRDRRVFFTEAEAQVIERYSKKVEPVKPSLGEDALF